MKSARWESTPLGDVVQVLDHKRIPVSAKERAARGGTVPYYGATGQVGWIDGVLFDEPLLLLGEDGVQFFDRNKSKAYIIDGPAWVNNHAHVLRVRGDVADRRFLMYQLNWLDYQGYANGTTRLKLTKSAMTRLPVLLPGLEEQRRIVEILEDHLSRLDAGSAALVTARRRIDALRASSAAEALRSEPGSADTTMRFGDRDLPLPRNWRASTVGHETELVEYGTGAKASEAESSEAVPVLRMGNIKAGMVVWDSLKFLPASHSEVEKLRLRSGDLLFNRTNSAEHVGKCAVFQGEREATFASYLIRARFSDSVDPRWASLVINSVFGRAYVKSVVSQQVGQANVNGTKLRAFPLPVPPRPVQDALLTRVAARDQAARSLGNQIDRESSRVEALRRSLLAAAFSGRLTGSSAREVA